jgi:hypothetical protein
MSQPGEEAGGGGGDAAREQRSRTRSAAPFESRLNWIGYRKVEASEAEGGSTRPVISELRGTVKQFSVACVAVGSHRETESATFVVRKSDLVSCERWRPLVLLWSAFALDGCAARTIN